MASATSRTDECYGMDSKSSHGTSAFEFFLYAAIIVETALAAFVYKVVFRDGGVAALNISMAVIYFAFLAWAIVQLNILHRRRKLQETIETERGATPPQTVAVIEGSGDAPRILGLTAAQAIVVFVVFAAAVVSFTWIFSTLHPNG